MLKKKCIASPVSHQVVSVKQMKIKRIVLPASKKKEEKNNCTKPVILH